MKKFVVLALFGLLILASTASAQKLEFKASGMIDFNTVWNTNVPFYFGQVGLAHAVHGGLFQTWGTPAFINGQKTNSLDKPTAYAYSRGLLRFDAIMDKNLSGTIYFEIDAFRWGGGPGWNSASSGALGVGSFGGMIQQPGERNTAGVWSTDRAAVEVKNLYFDVGLPYFGIPVPMTVRVGMQPFGVRPRMLVYTDGAGITAGLKAGPVTIIPMWGKIGEGLDWAADDSDLYGLHGNVKLGTFTIGGYGLGYKMNTYPLAYASAFAVGGIFPAVSSSYGIYAAGTQKAEFWWLGLYADGKAGPVNLAFDFVYDNGRVEQKNMIGNTFGSVRDVWYSGWAGRINIDFPWQKFNFGMTGAYGSGNDAKDTSTGGLPGQPVANRAYGALGRTTKHVSGYVVPPGSESSPGFNEAIVMYSCFNASADGGTGISNVSNYFQVSKGGLGGTAFVKGYAAIKAMPWLKTTLQGLYIWDTTRNGNTFGTAVKNPGAPFANQVLKDSDDIGFELDLIAEIDIFKNLKGYVGYGYLWPGKAMDLYNGLGRNTSPMNPWNFTTRFIYTF